MAQTITITDDASPLQLTVTKELGSDHHSGRITRIVLFSPAGITAQDLLRLTAQDLVRLQDVELPTNGSAPNGSAAVPALSAVPTVATPATATLPPRQRTAPAATKPKPTAKKSSPAKKKTAPAPVANILPEGASHLRWPDDFADVVARFDAVPKDIAAHYGIKVAIVYRWLTKARKDGVVPAWRP